jgi:hypothetical protein
MVVCIENAPILLQTKHRSLLTTARLLDTRRISRLALVFIVLQDSLLVCNQAMTRSLSVNLPILTSVIPLSPDC